MTSISKLKSWFQWCQ